MQCIDTAGIRMLGDGEMPRASLEGMAHRQRDSCNGDNQQDAWEWGMYVDMSVVAALAAQGHAQLKPYA